MAADLSIPSELSKSKREIKNIIVSYTFYLASLTFRKKTHACLKKTNFSNKNSF